ncbi:hypothetical protein [Tsuneonella sp. HG222]
MEKALSYRASNVAYAAGCAFIPIRQFATRYVKAPPGKVTVPAGKATFWPHKATHLSLKVALFAQCDIFSPWTV